MHITSIKFNHKNNQPNVELTISNGDVIYEQDYLQNSKNTNEQYKKIVYHFQKERAHDLRKITHKREPFFFYDFRIKYFGKHPDEHSLSDSRTKSNYKQFLNYVIENIDINDNMMVHNEFMDEPIDLKHYIKHQEKAVIHAIDTFDSSVITSADFLRTLVKSDNFKTIAKATISSDSLIVMQKTLSKSNSGLKKRFYNTYISCGTKIPLDKPSKMAFLI